MTRLGDSERASRKKALLASRTAIALGISEDEACALLTLPRQQSFRINTLRVSDKQVLLHSLRSLGWEGEAYAWNVNGFTIRSGLEALRDSEAVKSGDIYIQNASSWLPVLALEPKAGEKIFDMCAAPGGKTSHIAQLTHNQAELWVNDNSKPRLRKMQLNLHRLGVKLSITTLYDARHLSRHYEMESFDKILLDAPCSGEGLINLNNVKDLTYWSLAQIKRLQALQKQLVRQAWHLLKPGGRLVYSTCTMAPEENELVIDYLLRTQDDTCVLSHSFPQLPGQSQPVLSWNDKEMHPSIQHALRLAPSLDLEAFFVCTLQKVASS